ncbi:hypothetical protein PAECIP111891_01220 [Paenibacillus allorhizoplanae]|uniref:Uncharacterized protein n=1 Tax=Paenibacillus allorhizoplanae TaxID=2905648 RepID=A0ABN8G861_9BACL|nr:hypothetical protein [Paenibacillus allorhizoplanae]CAH1197464.1 hypothetical protein PAECIP111891_01220 [Paenibacillus allorhizoplanae]
MEQGDVRVILLILIVIVCIVFWRFQKWSAGSSRRRGRIPRHANIPEDDVVDLLEAAGFEVLAGKTKIPITMTVGEREQLESRLFIDYFVQKEDDIYLVKVARERKPLEMTGSAVRDMLLPYTLIYPEAQGILYVDMTVSKIKKITFHIEV